MQECCCSKWLGNLLPNIELIGLFRLKLPSWFSFVSLTVNAQLEIAADTNSIMDWSQIEVIWQTYWNQIVQIKWTAHTSQQQTNLFTTKSSTCFICLADFAFPMWMAFHLRQTTSLKLRLGCMWTQQQEILVLTLADPSSVIKQGKGQNLPLKILWLFFLLLFHLYIWTPLEI